MLVYRTREALNANPSFLENLKQYVYYQNCYVNDKFLFWHYPGTDNEISNVLLEIGKNKNGARLKFPAILNYQSIRQQRDGLDATIYYNLAIAGSIRSDWTTEQREVQVFDKLLRPIYAEFMRQISRCGYFKIGYGYPPHTYYEVFTTGKNATDLAIRYGDHIDAIELHNLELTVKYNLCYKDAEKIESDNSNVTKDINEILNY